MNGKQYFTTVECDEIRQLLTEKQRSSPTRQKSLRSKLRRLGFHIRDFTNSVDGFVPEDFDRLVRSGRIKVVEDFGEDTTAPKVIKQRAAHSKIGQQVTHQPVAGDRVVRLKPFLRDGLDVLFVALNPPVQSNANGHYFSGKGSRFFKLLYLSGLIAADLPKLEADEFVFGGTTYNHKGAHFGVVDLVEDLVETDSTKVRLNASHVATLSDRIRRYEPRFVCAIHSKVRDAMVRHGDLVAPFEYGVCGPILRHSKSMFVLNYFPNGNAIADGEKLRIFSELRDML